ncbi:MAG: hypothetical protein CME62_10160 [Halobacteriovoraceae bacterium]|nr:hypothetical protein [Halobacteriovoraceae bacterium]|tara:strand:- start:22082 stop:22387 length:306 start_codon:yes stop_codon:yes gene_type:complete
MQKIILIATFVLTTSAMAQIVNTNWQYNRKACRAETICPNGRPIFCQTVGFRYGNAPAIPNNMCRTRVVPGQLVHCQGYADKVNAFGQIVFVPVNLPVACY